MQKLMVEFLGKFENQGIKIVGGVSLNLQLFTLILYGDWGALWC